MRTNEVILICGMPGTGKTTLAKEMVRNKEKVIVFDFAGNTWTEFPIMNPILIPALKKGIKRIVGHDTDIAMKKLPKYRNGFLVFDDATNYVDYFRDKNLIQILTLRRHRNVDSIFIFHSLRTIPVDFYKYSSYLILFKTNDTEKEIKNLMKLTKFDEILKAYQELKDSKNKHESKIIKLTT